MSRNSSGTMTGINGPYTAGTTISSSAVNARLSDIETEITDSASRSGKGGFSAPVRAANGTVAAPAFSYTSEPGTGHYLAGTGDLRLAVSGVDALHLAAGGVIGPLTLPGGTTAIQVTLASGFLLLQGNLNATDATNADTVLSSTATRTAGYLAAVQNPVGISKLLIDYQGLLRLNNAAALQPASIWTAITPNAGWTAGSNLAYFKDAAGLVHLRGTVTFATGGAANAFTLPAGFRPSANRSFAGWDASGVAVGMWIDSAGALNIPAPINAHVYFVDVIAFMAEA